MRNVSLYALSTNIATQLAVACLLCALPTLSHAQGAAATQTAKPSYGGHPIMPRLTYIKLRLQGMSPAERQQALIRYASIDMFIDVPDLWKMDEPDIILRAILSASEPYPARWLDALARIKVSTHA
jgi:hypothetical protein